jgi:HD-GYP domain-containing protein (c-di-GMP phosphodiesterase class II)
MGAVQDWLSTGDTATSRTGAYSVVRRLPVSSATPAPLAGLPDTSGLALHRLLLDLTEQMVTALAEAIEARDPSTGGHCKRLASRCLATASYLALTPDRQHRLRLAAYLHDVGKISVPDAILMKPGPLTPEEYGVMQLHPNSGALLLTRMPLLSDIAPIVAAHHERYDGGGYPRGLRRDQIPLEAAILSVADCFDALTQDRPYRQAVSIDQALDEIRMGRETQFHPVAVDAFLAIANQLDDPI